MYMEKILKHKFDDIALDLDNLRRVSRALEEDQNNNAPSSLPPGEDPIEEEVCTIDPVEGTTTRAYPFVKVVRTNHVRLLWGVFLLELLHARETAN